MSTHLKLILPHIEGLDKSDFNPSTGFVNGYTYNKNHPEIYSHIFLLYDGENISYDNAKVFSKFQTLKNIYSINTVKIGGKMYRLYTFSLIGKKMANLLRGVPSFESEDKIKTFNFWGFEDSDINKLFLGEDPLLCADKTSVPEEDYRLSDPLKTSTYEESLATKIGN